MFGLTGFRLGGAIAGVLALVAVVAGAVWLIRDRERLQGVERAGIACEIAVRTGEATTSCPQSIADATTRSRRYQDCDAALAKADLYGVRAACSGAVKARDAQATALAADSLSLARQLAEARDALAGVIARSSARFDALLRKDRNAQAAISRAPRAADGRITCDDRCLRDLVGE